MRKPIATIFLTEKGHPISLEIVTQHLVTIFPDGVTLTLASNAEGGTSLQITPVGMGSSTTENLDEEGDVQAIQREVRVSTLCLDRCTSDEECGCTTEHPEYEL